MEIMRFTDRAIDNTITGFNNGPAGFSFRFNVRIAGNRDAQRKITKKAKMRFV